MSVKLGSTMAEVIEQINANETAVAKKLDKTTYEYNKELALGSSGKVCIGKFSMYDSNITVDISSTTNTTYSGTLVIATQNINDSHGGTYIANVYGDASGTLTSKLVVIYPTTSRWFEIYCDFPTYSKNLIHIQALGLKATPTDVATTVTTIPTDNKITVTNLLTSQFATKSVATTSANGLMSSSDKTKLDGIESGANKVDTTKHSYTQLTNEDLNTLNTTDYVGWYYAAIGHSCSNAPTSPSNSFYLEVVSKPTTQIAYVESAGSPKIYVRNQASTGWTGWKQIATTDDINESGTPTNHSQITIPSGSDLNDYYGVDKVGWYSVVGGGNILNTPTGLSMVGFSLEVLYAGGYSIQRLMPYTGTLIYIRRGIYTNTLSWSSWVEFKDSSQFVDLTNDQTIYGKKTFNGQAIFESSLSFLSDITVPMVDINSSLGEDLMPDDYLLDIHDANGGATGDTIFGVRYDGGGTDTATVILGQDSAIAPLEVGGTVGTAGQVLMSQGAGKTPKWGNVSGGSGSSSNSELVHIVVQTAGPYNNVLESGEVDGQLFSVNCYVVSGRNNFQAGDFFEFAYPQQSRQYNSTKTAFKRIRNRYHGAEMSILSQDNIDYWNSHLDEPMVIKIKIPYEDFRLRYSYTNTNSRYRKPFIVRVKRKITFTIEDGRTISENRTISNHCHLISNRHGTSLKPM